MPWRQYAEIRPDSIGPESIKVRKSSARADQIPTPATNYHLGYRNEYPLASFPDMNLVLYSSK